MRPSVRDAYDAIAVEYDRQLEDDDWMRRIVWQQYLQALQPGHRVLDVGCGTGTDAIFLAQCGIQVTAIDISPAMIALAESKAIHQGVAHNIQWIVQDIEELQLLPAQQFDGIISSFASLNTFPTLMQFASNAHRLLRPNGRLILHLLNGTSLWEWSGLIKQGRWREAWLLGKRQQRTFVVGGLPLLHYMPRGEEVFAQYFARHFQLCRIRGLGITRPPHPIAYLPDTVLAALTRLDEIIGSYRPFLNRGRFVVLDMVSDSRPPAGRTVPRNAQRGP